MVVKKNGHCFAMPGKNSLKSKIEKLRIKVFTKVVDYTSSALPKCPHRVIVYYVDEVSKCPLSTLRLELEFVYFL